MSKSDPIGVHDFSFQGGPLLQAIFDRSPIGKALTCPDGRLMRVNQSFAGMVGYSPDEMITLNFTHITHPDDIEVSREVIRSLLENEVNTRRFEKRYLHRNGEIVWCDVSTTLLRDESGSPLAFITCIMDISHKKQTEMAMLKRQDTLERQIRERTSELEIHQQLLNETSQIARMGGWETDLVTGDLSWTSEIYRIHEVGPDFHPTVETGIRFYAPESLPVISEAYKQLVETGKSYDLELYLITAKGRRICVRAIGYAIRKDGAIVKVRGVFQDISERKILEVERLKLETELRHAQKMEAVGRLAGGVAHDFNNMLCVVTGYGEALLEELRPNDPLQKHVQGILGATRRLTDLTRQLLAISRKQVFQLTVLDINEILRNFDDMLRRTVGEDIEFRMLLCDNLDRVAVDAGQMEQVILNLVINARDAMPEGGKLTIETKNASYNAIDMADHPGIPAGRYAQISVADNGCGMDPVTQSRIFEPFYTTKATGKGTGLGLSTVYGIVKQMGGQIRVYSELGLGSTFRVLLPAASAANGTEAAPVITESRDYRGNGELLLVVEDEPAVQELVRMILETMNYKIRVASNGGDALLFIEEEGLRPDLLITDLVMPGMNGCVLAERLRKRVPNLKTLYMSGYTNETTIHHGMLDKEAQFIQKPFKKSDLCSKIRTVLDTDNSLTRSSKGRNQKSPHQGNGRR